MDIRDKASLLSTKLPKEQLLAAQEDLGLNPALSISLFSLGTPAQPCALSLSLWLTEINLDHFFGRRRQLFRRILIPVISFY